MKLSIPEFLEIRERRSQDDMKTLIAFVEHKLGVAAAQPAGPAALADTGDTSPPAEPQTVVTVAPSTPPPPAPELQTAPAPVKAAPKRSRTTTRSASRATKKT